MTDIAYVTASESADLPVLMDLSAREKEVVYAARYVATFVANVVMAELREGYETYNALYVASVARWSKGVVAAVDDTPDPQTP